MNPLSDTDPMPFGKHRSVPMQDIPASYLHYLWTHGMETDKSSAVADYIRRNIDALKLENRDLIWGGTAVRPPNEDPPAPFDAAAARRSAGEAWMICNECGAKLWSRDGDRDADTKCPYKKGVNCEPPPLKI